MTDTERKPLVSANNGPWTYAHMCRDEHIQIGHNDSSSELCPLCRVMNALARCEELAGRDGPANELDALNEIELVATRALKAARGVSQ